MFEFASTLIERLAGQKARLRAKNRRRSRFTRNLRGEMLEDRRLLAQTAGVFVNEAGAFEGYTLFAPSTSTTTYLINNEGQEINSWQSDYNPMPSYLLQEIPGTPIENGDLMRAGQVRDAVFGAPGSSGVIEIFDWEGNLKWDYRYSNANVQLHHDLEMLPNGNILGIAWEVFTPAEAMAAGRAQDLLTVGGELTDFWPDKIIEIEPDWEAGTGGDIVWQWHLWDHLVQDDFPAKANYYGVDGVADHPELADINYENGPTGAGEFGAAGNNEDWTHFNGIDYDAELDQIAISGREFSEFWIIDHSTMYSPNPVTNKTDGYTGSHTGGNSGMGGDILYRWGNPRTYGGGTVDDQQMWYQHDATWIEEGRPGAGNITIFDNGMGRTMLERYDSNFSVALEVDTPLEAGGYTYDMSQIGADQIAWSYEAAVNPNPSFDGPFFAPIISGAQRLPNGNTLITEGTKGHFIEVTDAGEVVWDYVNPVLASGPIHQGDPIPVAGFVGALANMVFKIDDKYPADYAGLVGKDLTPGATIELNPRDTAGLFVPSVNTWYLNNRSDGSIQDLVTFDAPNVPASWTPIAGNWNATGGDTVGLYDPSTGTWYLNNEINGDVDDLIVFTNNDADPSWLPVAGDWDGDGFDTTGLYDPATNTWYLNNRTDGTFVANGVDGIQVNGPQHNSPGWRPIAGDWDGDEVDTIGLYDPATNTWYLNNMTDGSWNPDGVDAIIATGPQHNSPGWQPIAGDWNSDGYDTIGLYVPSANIWYLNNETDGTIDDLIVLEGPQHNSPGWMPIVGNWDNSGLPPAPAGGGGGAGGEGEWVQLTVATGTPVLAQNPLDAFDVNGDGIASSLDVLAVVHSLSIDGPHPVAADDVAPGQQLFVDVNGDGMVTPLDALQLISYINQISASAGEAEGEASGVSDDAEAPVAVAVTPLDLPITAGLVVASDDRIEQTSASSEIAVPVYEPVAEVLRPTQDAANSVIEAVVGQEASTADATFDELLDDLAVDIGEAWDV